MRQTGTFTGDDGEFRFCDLFPGNYRLTVSPRNMNPESTFAIATETIADRDLTGVKLPTSPRISVDAEAVLEGPQPQTPISVKAGITLSPLFRTQMPGEKTNVRLDIP